MDWYVVANDVLENCLTVGYYGAIFAMVYIHATKPDGHWFTATIMVVFFAVMSAGYALEADNEDFAYRVAARRVITTILMGASGWFNGRYRDSGRGRRYR